LLCFVDSLNTLQENEGTSMKTMFYLLILLFISFSTFADVYKCVSGKGKVSFSDKRCSHGKSVAISVNNEEYANHADQPKYKNKANKVTVEPYDFDK